MFYRSLLSATSIAASVVTAANVAPNVPANGQIGALNFPITCQIPILGDLTLAGFFIATAPSIAASGQEIYYTDVAANITIPTSLTTLGQFVGVKQASALVKLNLNLTNASPAVFPVFPNGLQVNNIPIEAGKPAIVSVPKTGVLAPIGPVTMGAAGTTHTIHLGNINVVINLQDAKGKTLLGPLPVTCGKQPVNFDIGIVNIGPATGAGPLKIETGVQNKFAKIKNLYETGSFRFPYTCDFAGPLGSRDVDLALTGTIKTFFAPGESFSLTDAEAFLRIPSSIVSDAAKAYPGVTSYRTTVQSFTIGTENASPASLNALKSPITVTTTPIDGQEVDIPIPETGTLSIGPITAGQAGSEAFIIARDAAATITFLNAAGKSVGSSSVTCSPKQESKIIGVAVTTSKPRAVSN